jgi:hypothetical protein
MSNILPRLKDVSPKQFVLIQLVLQVCLLVSSIICLTVATHVLELRSECTVTVASLATISEEAEVVIAKQEGGQKLTWSGLSMMLYGLPQLLSSSACVLVHIFCGYIAKPVYIRVHIVITILLFAICMFSLVHVIVLEVFLTRHTTTSLHCIAEARHNRLSSWLPAVIPVLLASVAAHIVTAVLLIITNLTHRIKETPVRVRINSDRNPPIVPSMVISQVVDALHHSADAMRGNQRQRLPSIRSLHVAIAGSPYYEIPLTPAVLDRVNNNEDIYEHMLSPSFAPTTPTTPMLPWESSTTQDPPIIRIHYTPK